MKMELIAALLHDPKVIFLDEPTIGLDVNAQSAMREFLALYRREKKPIILLTSHYMKDIEALCERIILIHGGRFVYDGSLKEALKRLNGSRTLTLELEAPLTPEQLKKFETTHRGVTANLLNPLRLEVKIPREFAREQALDLLKTFPSQDFTLEDEDIGDTLGRWIAQGGRLTS